jgi:hypothetical protein
MRSWEVQYGRLPSSYDWSATSEPVCEVIEQLVVEGKPARRHGRAIGV